MLDFIQLLIQRYRSMAKRESGEPDETPPFDNTLASLTLAEAALHKLQLNRERPQHAPQIAVIGPTQAGKSTVVNLLLGSPLAGVSALAGFTVHPQGFYIGSSADRFDWLPQFFPGYEQHTRTDLAGAPYRAYALSDGGNSPLPPCIIWDTPDFDSIDASGYRDAVLRTIALADLLLLVVSKDKYADQRVWETLNLLLPLGRPLVVCINKLGEESREVVLNSFRNHLREAGIAVERFPVCTLPYQKNLDETARGIDPRQAETLRTQLTASLGRIDRDGQPRHTYAFIGLHWQGWINPILAEHAADQAWKEMVEQAMESALSDYRRDYLDHPQNYETFQQAIAELLSLLEIPLLADSLNKVRQTVTWPLRQLISAGKSLFGKQPAAELRNSNLEQRLLNQICHHTLVHLAEESLRISETEAAQADWWKSIARSLRSQRPEIEEQFARAVEAYQKEFQPEIERSAHSLYEKLEQQPATLNSLRAARVTTDAAAVVLAVKSGGLSIHDLVVAPAMLSLTSMLTESTLGRYMDKVAAELKQRQLEMVNAELLADLQQKIFRLKEAIDPAQRFRIPPGTVTAAEQELRELENGN